MNETIATIVRVVHFQRRPRAVHFSVERISATIRKHLPPHFHCDVAVSRFDDRGLWRRLYNIIEASARQGDINHITGDVNLLSLLMRKRRTILTVLDLGGLLSDKGWRAPLRRLWFWTLPSKRCSYFVAISEKTRTELLHTLPVDPDRVRVIHVPVCAEFQPVPYEFNAGKPRILQIRTWENKNVIRVAKALKGMRCHLRIVGRLTEEQEQALIINDVEYSNVYDISNEAILAEYRDSDMVVFASTFEGFGMPIIEGQATGRPVITSHIPPMPEVAGAGACLVDPLSVDSIREGIVRVINDEHYRAALIKHGFDNVRRFSASKIALEYAKLYEEMIHDLREGD